MIRILLLAAAGGLCTSGCARIEPLPTSGFESTGADRQLLVTTSQTLDSSALVLGDPAAFYVRRSGYGPSPAVDRLLDEIARKYGVRRVEGWFIASIGEYCEVYELTTDQSLDEAIRMISNHPGVELVQAINSFDTEAMTYNDPLAAMQPALSTLAIETAHEFATGQGVTVAIIDSSVDRRHPDLRGQVRQQRNLVRDSPAREPEIHGTAVAGIIGSAFNNGKGIVGVAPEARLASLRACWTADYVSGRAQCSSFSLALALDAAIQIDSDIINLSLSGPADELLARIIDSAIDRGIIVVAALPDGVASAGDFPATHPGVIAAQSSESPDTAAVTDTLRAPGREIMSTVPNDGYAVFSGNSMSAAYVSGVAALIRQLRPSISGAELSRLLRDTSDADHINACRAVSAGAASVLCP